MTQRNKNQAQRIAFFGGAFDPPHLGHRAVCQWLAASESFDAVWVVPSYRHPFNKAMSPFEHRFAMCTLQLGNIPKVTISSIEKATGLSYTYDLLQLLKRDQPSSDFTLVLGSDTLRELDRWKNAEALRREVPILEIPRKGWADSPFPKWQSSTIRQEIAKGKDQTEQVGTAVMAYIRKNQLYR